MAKYITVRERREAMGLSLNQLAAKLNVARSTISRIEYGQAEGKNIGTIDSFAILAKFFGCHIEELIIQEKE